MNCPCCDVVMEIRKNPNGGGTFRGCTNFADTGCKVSYSPSEDKWYGLPGVQARASSLRGRATSLRESTIAKLLAQKGFLREEAVEYIDALGLDEVMRLLK